MMTSKAMLEYQYREILGQLSLLELHALDPNCPCTFSGGDLHEFCIPKHTLVLGKLASETLNMETDPKLKAVLGNLQDEAADFHAKTKACFVCGKCGPMPDIAEWARKQRKEIEPYYYACNVKPAAARATLKAKAPVGKFAQPKPISITGTCEVEDHACAFKVKAADITEGSTGSIGQLNKLIQDVAARAATKVKGVVATDKTWAPGISTSNRYEFEFKVVDAVDLIVSHDPFTFEINPKYTAKIQPRIRERLANQMQVRKIASRLDPEKLLLDTKAIDTGSPIIGPDNLVECGNGRVMALILAAKEHPANIVLYQKALKEVALGYGLPVAPIDKMKLPVLVRLRLTPVNRQEFAEECNARPTIEASAIEKARTDSDKITPAMLSSLDILEGEAIERALRSDRNKPFVTAFLSKMPENEQALLIDAHGILNTDGVRRMVMAIFVATFKGTVGLRLAEKFFESIDDTNVKNAFNGIVKSLGAMAVAENLVASGQRYPGLAFGEDLAKTITVFSNLKAADMSVANYLAQQQLGVRDLSPFQEKVLRVLDEHTRSAKRIGNLLTNYAQLVIDSVPPGQKSLMAMEPPSKERLFDSAVKRMLDEVVAEQEAKAEKAARREAVTAEPVARLFAPPSELGVAGRISGHLPSNLPTQYSTGRWGFVGRVDARLAYERKDGQPATDEDYKAAQRMGPSIVGMKTRTWATKEEALAAAAALATPAVKEPWQMTRAEFKEAAKQDWLTYYKAHLPRRPIKFPETQAQLIADDAVGSHKNFVRQALSEGKPVPAEVLKDYPDLAGAAPKAPLIPVQARLFSPRRITKAEWERILKYQLPLPEAEVPKAVAVPVPCPPVCPGVPVARAHPEVKRKYELFPFQKEGVAWLKGRSYALLADEMGLGKTPQAIHWGADLSPVLVVVPAALTLNWEREIKEMWRSQDTVMVLDGKVDLPHKLPQWTIMSYGQLNRYLPALKRAGFRAIITDEAHLIKNLDTQRTKNILELVAPREPQKTDKPIPNRLAVTGTPIVNRPFELYSLLVFLGVKTRDDFRPFLERYTEHKVMKGRMVFTGARNLNELHQSLKPFMLRRLKKDVLKQLPPKLHTPMFVAITNAAEYREAERNFLSWLRETKGNEAARRAAAAEIITRMNALRQLTAMGKVGPICDWLKPCQDGQGKVLIFSSFIEPLQGLAKCKPGMMELYTGGLAAAERQEIVDRFQTDPNLCYFAGTVGAAGVGITLTAAARVCFLDLPWTPGGKIQAEDRAHRIGQTQKVEVVNVLAKGTIDERMLEILREKEFIIAQAIDGKTRDEAASTSISEALIASYIRAPVMAEPVQQYESDMGEPELDTITDDQLEIAQGFREPVKAVARLSQLSKASPQCKEIRRQVDIAYKTDKTVPFGLREMVECGVGLDRLRKVYRKAEVAEFDWLAKKLTPCNLTDKEVNTALAWKPLRNFIAWAVGLGKPVKLCSVGMVAGTYQLGLYDLDSQMVGTAQEKAKEVPNMRRVYSGFGIRELVYEVRVPIEEEARELTWKPQEVMQPRGERGEQPVLFEPKPRWCYSVEATAKELGKLSARLGKAKLKVGELSQRLETPVAICRGQKELFDEGQGGATMAEDTIKVSGKCPGASIETCTFKVRRVGQTVKAQGYKELVTALEGAMGGRARTKAVAKTKEAVAKTEKEILSQITQAMKEAEAAE